MEEPKVKRILHIAKRLFASVKLDDKRARKHLEKQIESITDYLYENADRVSKGIIGLYSISKLEDKEHINQAKKFIMRAEKVKTNAERDKLLDELSKLVKKSLADYKHTHDAKYITWVRFLQDLDEILESEETPPDPEREAKEYRSIAYKQYGKGLAKLKRDLVSKVSKYMSKVKSTYPVVVEAEIADAEITDAHNRMPIDAHIKLQTPRKPSMTVFVEDGKLIVDDVLEYGDTDFFTDAKEMKIYFGLVDYLRTGKFPKSGGTIKLYRGMSDIEYEKWQHGGVIPVGKFFTNKRTNAYAQDISGKSPNLYTFIVDSNIVAETDEGTWQLTDSGILKGNRIISK